MGKKQTRRSISIRGTIYARIKNYCDAEGIACSAYVEKLVTEALDAAGVPVVKVAPAYPKRVRPEPEITSQHFTF